MKIIAMENELSDASSERFQELAREEAAVLYALQQQGIVRESFFRSDRNEAVLILEVESATAAEKALGRLPFVKEGLIRFELIPLKPYSGLSRLFRSESKKREGENR